MFGNYVVALGCDGKVDGFVLVFGDGVEGEGAYSFGGGDGVESEGAYSFGGAYSFERADGCGEGTDVFLGVSRCSLGGVSACSSRVDTGNLFWCFGGKLKISFFLGFKKSYK